MSQAVTRFSSPQSKRPRLAFVGLGWIGRNRLESIAKSGLAEVIRLSDVQSEAVLKAKDLVPDADAISSFEELLESSCEGIVIATPNALHAEQARLALERGMAVFCQKPLARNAFEARQVVTTAREVNRLLGVDLSYRFVPAIRKVRDLISSRSLGHVFAIDLKFHNAYGPDKDWFYSHQLSGGGCVLDLGSHLIDLALWTLSFPRVVSVSSSLFAEGKPLEKPVQAVEDYAVAQIDLEGPTTVRLACSWKLNSGCEADIEVTFYGTSSGARMRNVAGSFYDFVSERFLGTHSEMLGSEPNDSGWGWGSLAALDWCRKLASGNGFDSEAEHFITTAEVIDQIYGKAVKKGE